MIEEYLKIKSKNDYEKELLNKQYLLSTSNIKEQHKEKINEMQQQNTTLQEENKLYQEEWE